MSISIQSTVKILVCAILALAITQFTTQTIVGSAAAQAPTAACSVARSG